jgi:omega-amidase
MKITAVQTNLLWEDRENNLAHFDELLKNASDTNLILLPEMFTTGFSMRPVAVAEPSGGPGLDWMKKKAAEKKAVVCGSIAVSENGKYFNRLFWVEPDGNVRSYDKRHLFRMGGEDNHYTPGNKKIITKIGEWNICPLVCYDLRFPVWSRNRLLGKNYEYDLLIYVANWPEVRAYQWKQLLIARAIENQCYVVGLNRTGNDGNGVPHSGSSLVIDPKGQILLDLGKEEHIASLSLDLTLLRDFRRSFPAAMDADQFELF